MARSATFRASDMARALKGAEAAGMRIAEVEITKDGSILLRSHDTLPSAERAVNASGYVEAKIAAAPWAKSK
jgi:hypothetical protein